MIRVLVVGRSAPGRAELASVLAGNGQLEVVGQAGWVEDRARLVGAPGTDVVVAALERRDERAVTALLALAAESGPPVVAVVDDADPGWASAAWHAGVSAVLPRDAAPAALQAAVVAVASGLLVMRRADLLDGPGATVASLRGHAPPAGAVLTRRELEVLGLVAAGLGNKAIAAQLAVTERTVKSHVGAIFEKLGVASRTEAVTTGLRRGLILL